VWAIFRISYWYYTVVGTLIVLGVGYPLSIYCGDASDLKRERQLNPNLFSPVVRRFLPPLPTKPEDSPLVELSAQKQ
jgi:hypothetical protein